MRILSIDWDYFVKASLWERADMFPDSPSDSHSSVLSTFIWNTLYASSRMRNELYGLKKMEDIGFDQEATEYICNLVKSSTYLYYTESSHMWLGDFLLNSDTQQFLNGLMLDDTDLENLEIVNIDHHSDLYNQGTELNCGNWLNKVMEKYKNAKLLWVANGDSLSDELENLEYQNRVTVTGDLADVKGDFDMVFLCRSDPWSPPHLDYDYTDFDNYLREHAHLCISEGHLLVRYTKGFKKSIEDEYKDRKALAGLQDSLRGLSIEESEYIQ